MIPVTTCLGRTKEKELEANFDVRLDLARKSISSLREQLHHKDEMLTKYQNMITSTRQDMAKQREVP